MPLPGSKKKPPSLRTIQRQRKKLRDAVYNGAALRAAASDISSGLQHKLQDAAKDNLDAVEKSSVNSFAKWAANSVGNASQEEECGHDDSGCEAIFEHHPDAQEPSSEGSESEGTAEPFDYSNADHYFKALMKDLAQHSASQRVKSTVWNFMRKYGPQMNAVQQWKGYKTMDAGLRERLCIPDVLLEVGLGNTISGETRILRRESHLRRNNSEVEDTWIPSYVFSYVTLDSLLELHVRLHGGAKPCGMVLHVDGIPESNSGGRSLTVVTAQFPPCLSIYPVQVFRPMNKKNVSPQAHMDRIIQEIKALKIPLLYLVADAPMRAMLRGITAHSGKSQHFPYNLLTELRKLNLYFHTSGYLSCDLCEVVGVSHEGKVCFPPSDDPAEPRTNDRFREQVLAWQCDPSARRDARQHMGIRNISPFLQLDEFDIIEGIMPEMLHLLSLGVIKKTLMLAFEVGQKGYMSSRARRMKNTFNKELEKVRVPSEFSRRTRGLDFGSMKGEEYRNIIFFFFPLLIDLLTPELRQVTLLLVYCVRAFAMPDNEYALISEDVLAAVMDDFQKSFVSTFQPGACSYNFHVMSHLPRIRERGPITVGSATRFESYLAVVKATGVPNCANPAKLLMKELLLASVMKIHVCAPTTRFSTKRTNRRDDSVLRANGHWYCAEQEEQDHFICKPIVTKSADWDIGNGIILEFEPVGVFEIISQSVDVSQKVMKPDITGKGVIVGKYLVYAPSNLLYEY
jgi:hypothetical protein